MCSPDAFSFSLDAAAPERNTPGMPARHSVVCLAAKEARSSSLASPASACWPPSPTLNRPLRDSAPVNLHACMGSDASVGVQALQLLHCTGLRVLKQHRTCSSRVNACCSGVFRMYGA